MSLLAYIYIEVIGRACSAGWFLTLQAFLGKTGHEQRIGSGPIFATGHNRAVLRYVVAIADHGSFRSAAEALFISQPSLSAAIAKWEKQIGVDLFERGGRGIRITPSGEAVVTAARQALAALEQLKQQVRQQWHHFTVLCV